MAVITATGCRDAIEAFLLTLPNIGKVHNRRRVVRNEQDIKTLFYDGTQTKVCAWMISPSPQNPMVNTINPGYQGHGVIGGGNVLTAFQFQIEGIHVLDDAAASEPTFHNLACSVVDNFNAYGSIPKPGGGAIVGLDRQLQFDMQQFGFINFAGRWLFHYCRIEGGFLGRTRPNP